MTKHLPGDLFEEDGDSDAKAVEVPVRPGTDDDTGRICEFMSQRKHSFRISIFTLSDRRREV